MNADKKMDFKAEIAKKLAELPELGTAGEICQMIEIPPDSEMGDFAYPCFRLAKVFRKAPAQIASELAGQIEKPGFVSEIKAAGGYVNFYLDRGFFAEAVVRDVLEKGDSYGKSDEGIGKTVLIDYSSPNLTHQFHIGHLYCTVIGNVLVRLHKYLGYNTIGINYLGDWGSQFGKLITAYHKWGDKAAIERDGVVELSRIYIRFHEESEKDPSLEADARASFVRMESGDSEALRLWKWFREVCIEEFEKTYKRLDISFDSYRGESYYNDKMKAVVEEIAQKGLLAESDGAMIVDLEEYKMPPCLILKSDGGTLYPTRDIAAAFDRKRTYDFNKSIYVTDMRQSLHFAQFMKVIELMGNEWAKDMVHVPYGLLSLETGPLSARRGNIILLEDFFDEACRRAIAIIDEKNPSLANKEQVAEQVGIGAVIFGTLYNSRMKDGVFSWERALSFEGETGPYVQYTHARTCSLLAKAGVSQPTPADYTVLDDAASFEVIKLIRLFGEKVQEAADKYEPYIISRYLVAVAQAFNKFYDKNIILADDENTRNARLALAVCVKTVLAKGLSLLGIAAPKEM